MSTATLSRKRANKKASFRSRERLVNADNRIHSISFSFDTFSHFRRAYTAQVKGQLYLSALLIVDALDKTAYVTLELSYYENGENWSLKFKTKTTDYLTALVRAERFHKHERALLKRYNYPELVDVIKARGKYEDHRNK